MKSVVQLDLLQYDIRHFLLLYWSNVSKKMLRHSLILVCIMHKIFSFLSLYYLKKVKHISHTNGLNIKRKANFSNYILWTQFSYWWPWPFCQHFVTLRRSVEEKQHRAPVPLLRKHYYNVSVSRLFCSSASMYIRSLNMFIRNISAIKFFVCFTFSCFWTLVMIETEVSVKLKVAVPAPSIVNK